MTAATALLPLNATAHRRRTYWRWPEGIGTESWHCYGAEPNRPAPSVPLCPALLWLVLPSTSRRTVQRELSSTRGGWRLCWGAGHGL